MCLSNNLSSKNSKFTTNHCIYSEGSRLQYDTYYNRGDAPNDHEYHKHCPKHKWKSIHEKCSNNHRIEREWKQAYYCGNYNHYHYDKIVWKALDDIEHYTKDLKTIACVASTIYYLKHVDHCLNFVLTWWVIYLSGQADHQSRDWQKKFAEKWMKHHYWWFDADHHCPQYK